MVGQLGFEPETRHLKDRCSGETEPSAQVARTGRSAIIRLSCGYEQRSPYARCHADTGRRRVAPSLALPRCDGGEESLWRLRWRCDAVHAEDESGGVDVYAGQSYGGWLGENRARRSHEHATDSLVEGDLNVRHRDFNSRG